MSQQVKLAYCWQRRDSILSSWLPLPALHIWKATCIWRHRRSHTWKVSVMNIDEAWANCVTWERRWSRRRRWIRRVCSRPDRLRRASVASRRRIGRWRGGCCIREFVSESSAITVMQPHQFYTIFLHILILEEWKQASQSAEMPGQNTKEEEINKFFSLPVIRQKAFTFFF